MIFDRHRSQRTVRHHHHTTTDAEANAAFLEMKQPISVTVDPEWPIAYVKYLSGAENDGSLPLSRDPDGIVRDYTFAEKNYLGSGVRIDVTPDDEIIGFEIFDIRDEESVAIARDYARDNHLAFPPDLRAAAARKPAA